MSHIQLMGILNVTPDSFSDGGNYVDINAAIKRAGEMLAEGADIIDVGGESTRPGSEFVSSEDEISRVVPVITAIRKEFGDTFPISIDTNKSTVAKTALEYGATIVNSLGGFRFDESLADVVAQHKCKVVIYHIKGVPKTMQKEITYTDVIKEITTFFEEQIVIATNHGIKKEQLVLDPGIGFGKSVEHNLTLIRKLSEFKKLRLPILIGVSRKSHLGLLLQEKLSLAEIPGTDDRLSASLAETAIAIQNGATIIRTHDILQTKQFITVLEELI